MHHPHVHCVIPSGGLSPDHQAWVRPRYRFFLPVKVLSRIFRGKFVAGLKRAYCNSELCLPGDLQPLAQDKAFRSFLRSLFREDWFVYAKPPFGGPLHVFQYLARYTHRVAISNHRLVAFTDGKVTFRWKDYARGSKRRLPTVSRAGIKAPKQPQNAPAGGSKPHPDSLGSYASFQSAYARRQTTYPGPQKSIQNA